MATNTCPQCGTVNPPGSKFCAGCGINLTQRLHTTRPMTPGTPPPSRPVAQSGGRPAQTPPAASPGALRPGQSLQAGAVLGDGGRYVIDRPLGKGGMGSIFLAHDTRVNNKPVVIKQMLPNFSTEQERLEAEQSFQEEMKTLADMAHPGIPNISDYFSQSGFNFIVQEYIPGEDLQKKLDAAGGKGLPERDVLRWTSQVLSVLDYLEGLDPQIIHRDIKPANIVVEANGRVRVVDFGVASHKFRVGSRQASKNRASTAMGTPGYAPREQFLGQETTLSDVYALGATMHQLLTGHNPQPAPDQTPTFSYAPVRQLNPKISEATARVTAHALQNDPARRYQKAAQMKAEVDAILQPRGALSTLRGKAVALGLVAVLLVAVAGGVAVYEQRQTELPATGAISTGRVAFDRDITGRATTATDPKAWAKAKADASVQWKDGNLSRAQALYQQAVTNDQTDAESQIYVENASILSSGKPYWLLAVGSSISGPDRSIGRFALQGAYTAQHEINQAGGVAGRPVVLEVANDASGTSGAAEAARDAARDSALLAFLGYSGSSRTQAGFVPVTGAGIPLVTPTSSSPNLNLGGTTYFFRCVPSDLVQGQDLARFAQRTLLAGKPASAIEVFSDPNDRYSSDLANIFVGNLKPSVLVTRLSYTADVTTADQYASMLGAHARPSMIFFAGRAGDGLRLGQALDTRGDRTTPVLSDDAFYDPAQFNAYGAVFKGRYHFTGYFYPDEYSLLPSGSPGALRIKRMEVEYAQNFHAIGKPGGYGADRVPSEAALFYDAVKWVAQAIGSARPANGSVSRTSLRDALAATTYQGIAGKIAANETPAADSSSIGVGDPKNKALLIMHLDDQGHTHPEKILGSFQ